MLSADDHYSIEDLDVFYANDYRVGDYVRVVIGFYRTDVEAVYDVAQAQITSIVLQGSSSRVGLRFVYSGHGFEINIEEGRPFSAITTDFFHYHTLSPVIAKPVIARNRRRATHADKLARLEALYDYEIAALALSQNFLKTRNRAYKRE